MPHLLSCKPARRRPSGTAQLKCRPCVAASARGINGVNERAFDFLSLNGAGAIALVADLEWPPHAVTMRVLDLDGREVHSAVKGEGEKR
jgi:hypothetical protein